MSPSHSHTAKPIYLGTRVIWYLLGVLLTLLAIRFILKLLGASPTAGFTSFIYDLSYIFVAPFLNVFQVTEVNGSVFEWTTLLAMAIYYIIAWGVIRLLFMGRPVSTPDAVSKLDEAEDGQDYY